MKKRGRNPTHGMKNTRIYRVWCAMKTRCYNEKYHAYKHYGGRGIKVCERWNKFVNFYEDMKSEYKDSLEIDRINVNKNYCPENCRWATREEQNNNRRDNRFCIYKGEKITATALAKRFGLNTSTIRSRINKYGWSPEKAVNTPIKRISSVII